MIPQEVPPKRDANIASAVDAIMGASPEAGPAVRNPAVATQEPGAVAPTTAMRFLEMAGKTRGFAPEQLEQRGGNPLLAMYDNPHRWLKEWHAAFNALPPQSRAVQTQTYFKHNKTANHLALLKSYTELAELPSGASGFTTQIGNLGGRLPEWGEALEKNLGLKSKRSWTRIDPLTGTEESVGDDDGEIPISRIVNELGMAIGELEKVGLGEMVSPELRAMASRYANMGAAGAGIRTVLEFMATRAASKAVAPMVPERFGIRKAAEAVGGVPGTSARIGELGLGAVHGGASGLLGATLGGSYEEEVEKESMVAPAAEIMAAGGIDEWKDQQLESFAGKWWHAAKETVSGATHGAVGMGGWMLGRGGYRMGLDAIGKTGSRIKMGPELNRAQRIIIKHSGNALDKWRRKVQTLAKRGERHPSPAVQGFFTKANLLGSTKHGGDWVAGAFGSETVSKMVFGHPEPFPEALRESPLATFLLGAAFHSVGVLGVTGKRRARGLPEHPRSLEDLMRRSPGYMKRHIAELQKSGLSEAEILETYKLISEEGDKLTRDMVYGVRDQAALEIDATAAKDELVRIQQELIDADREGRDAAGVEFEALRAQEMRQQAERGYESDVAGFHPNQRPAPVYPQEMPREPRLGEESLPGYGRSEYAILRPRPGQVPRTHQSRGVGGDRAPERIEHRRPVEEPAEAMGRRLPDRPSVERSRHDIDQAQRSEAMQRKLDRLMAISDPPFGSEAWVVQNRVGRGLDPFDNAHVDARPRAPLPEHRRIGERPGSVEVTDQTVADARERRRIQRLMEIEEPGFGSEAWLVQERVRRGIDPHTGDRLKAPPTDPIPQKPDKRIDPPVVPHPHPRIRPLREEDLPPLGGGPGGGGGLLEGTGLTPPGGTGRPARPAPGRIPAPRKKSKGKAAKGAWREVEPGVFEVTTKGDPEGTVSSSDGDLVNQTVKRLENNAKQFGFVLQDAAPDAKGNWTIRVRKRHKPVAKAKKVAPGEFEVTVAESGGFKWFSPKHDEPYMKGVEERGKGQQFTYNIKAKTAKEAKERALERHAERGQVERHAERGQVRDRTTEAFKDKAARELADEHWELTQDAQGGWHITEKQGQKLRTGPWGTREGAEQELLRLGREELDYPTQRSAGGTDDFAREKVFRKEFEELFESELSDEVPIDGRIRDILDRDSRVGGQVLKDMLEKGDVPPDLESVVAGNLHVYAYRVALDAAAQGEVGRMASALKSNAGKHARLVAEKLLADEGPNLPPDSVEALNRIVRGAASDSTGSKKND